MSHFTCHLLHVTYHFFDTMLGGGRVCYQRGLPCLVSFAFRHWISLGNCWPIDGCLLTVNSGLTLHVKKCVLYIYLWSLPALSCSSGKPVRLTLSKNMLVPICLYMVVNPSMECDPFYLKYLFVWTGRKEKKKEKILSFAVWLSIYTDNFAVWEHRRFNNNLFGYPVAVSCSYE